VTHRHQISWENDVLSWGQKLRQWRRLNDMKQAGLASLLGVSQPTIARWERGLDQPSTERMHQIRDLMAGTLRDECALERLLIQRQSSIRALIDLDGMRLTTASLGYRQLWPQFATLVGVPMADKVINETRSILDDTDLIRSIQKGSVGMISGISERHMDIEVDIALKHRWDICFRRYGVRMYADIVFEPCDPEQEPGVYERIDFDVFGDIADT
jgi:transcriptional regulator with XRE-family HTH domain